jgi:hypothetical protein
MMRRSATAGFTLAELMVSAGIGSMLIATLITGTIALQKGYASADYSIRCQVEQMRVIDYIGRDLRRAITVTAENSGRKLALTVPDQKDPTTKRLRLPVVSNGVVRYGTDPIAVSYYIEGDLFIREEGGVRTTVANKRLENFLVTLNGAQSVTLQLAFTPTFSRRSGYGQAASTIVTTIPLPKAASAYE